jgi:septum formation protein
MNNIILASGSPRRAELLTQVGVSYKVVVSDYHEKMPDLGDDIITWVKYTASNKAKTVFDKTGGVVLGADTVVILPCENGEYYMGGRKVSLLGKPENENNAVNMLRRLSGKEHDVVTAYSIITENKTVVKAITTKVFFYELSDEDILNYVNTGEPMDKAGSYGIQAKGAVFVKSITGDYYNVVGLPISSVVADLKKLRI